MPRTVWMPLPDRDFDVTEVAVPWKLMTEAGYSVVIATEDGATPAADPLLLDGVIFGQLGAEPEPIRFYRELEADAAFRAPARWRDIDPEDHAGLWLAGGHAPGMRQYLGSEPLQEKIAAFWTLGHGRDLSETPPARSATPDRAPTPAGALRARRSDVVRPSFTRPVGAICHGVLCLARSRDVETGCSVLHGHKTTCLPKYMERTAYYLTAWKLGRYYRTYEAYVEDEVRAALASPEDFVRGPRTLTSRGTREDDGPAFVVEDGRYVSARWPGDSYLVAKRFIERLDAAGG
jgi:putative intracellular protease/amidase